MATGYNVILPNRKQKHVIASTQQQRMKICNELIKKWEQYCEQNWITFIGGNDPYSPQNKVKLFLSSLGYFLLYGNTDGIVTRYKDIVNRKRQLPVSSCPDYLQDGMYGSVHSGGSQTLYAKQQQRSFNTKLDALDYKASKYKKPTKKKYTQTRYDRVVAAKNDGAVDMNRHVVDSDGVFQLRDQIYSIDMSKCKSYASKDLGDGDIIYDMDYVISADMNDGSVRFYDANFNRIDYAISKCQCD